MARGKTEVIEFSSVDLVREAADDVVRHPLIGKIVKANDAYAKSQ